ncbi:hypothetical protein CRM22_005144 [Opisthorchis felineus]|uniref:CBS domain-containing protein n=1 Tax=Opisthorchis felineus TaxID=147828 RepID=A0A4S2LZ47_OPIFE|nr:hypothetical protein CRM22_005144 [Opisthorchis felineus]
MSGGDGPMSMCKGRRRYSSLSGEKYMVVWDTHKGPDSLSDVHIESLSDTDKSYRVFLKGHTCYDLIPLSAKLVVFDVTLNVKKAFFALVYNGVRVAILWDSDEQRHVGMLTITDFIRILHQYYRSPTIPMTELENHQIKTWREQLADYQRPLVSITPEKTLLEAVQKLLNHKVHRLPVIDPIGGNPLHILTHKRVLKYLYIHLNQLPSPSFMSKKLRDLKLGTTDGVITVGQDCPLHRTLQLFIEHRVSALPVVDSNGQLVDIYAKFDVINLAATRTYQNLDITVYDALNYRRGKFQGVATCQLDDTLESIVNRIAEAGVHRLVIVEDNKVIGVVSLSDLLRFLISEPLVEAMMT